MNPELEGFVVVEKQDDQDVSTLQGWLNPVSVDVFEATEQIIPTSIGTTRMGRGKIGEVFPKLVEFQAVLDL